jgi:mono/diheme cytochrome c family protein
MGAAGLAIVEFGWFDIAASSPHSQLLSWATHATMIHAVQTQAKNMPTPKHFSTAQRKRGFALYEANCVMCHGGPGVPRAAWASGLNPPPPYLVDAARQWTAAQLKLIVSNGVKMTGMPAWDVRLPESQLWDIVAFLEQLDGMPPAIYEQMRRDLRRHSAVR